MKEEELKKEINHILNSGANDVRLVELFKKMNCFQSRSPSIKSQVESIDIKHEFKYLLLRTIQSDLFRMFYMETDTDSIVVSRYQNENDNRVFAEVTICVKKSIELFAFRPFIDQSCGITAEGDLIKLRKTYYL